MSDKSVIAAAEEQLVLEGTEILEEKATLTVEEIVDSLVVEERIYSAYEIYKIVKGVFEVIGFEKRNFIPQMMYNYSRNGLISKRAEKPNKDHRYTRSEVATFVKKYVNRTISK